MEGRITENSLAEAFDRIDADDSGYISHKVGLSFFSFFCL